MTTVTIGGARTTSSRSTILKPWVVDAGFVLLLVTVGLVSFRPTYGGQEYLLVGVIGGILGVALTELAQKLRQPVLAEAIVTVLAFLLFGGAMTTNHGIAAGLIPTVKSVTELAHVGVYGWKELLTTPLPVGSSSNLLAIPYIVGLAGGVTGQSLGRRTRSAGLPLIGPVFVLCIGILFGAPYPASVVVQGSLFAFLALTWVALRYQRRMIVSRGFGRNRIVVSAGLLALVGLTAGVVGPNLPGAKGRNRVVLSQYVVPPFQASEQPSPLAGFRQYVQNGPLNNKVLFTVHGLPQNSEIRIATMDDYDGVTWGFGTGSSSAVGTGDVFRQYGSTIQPTGELVKKVSVTIGQLGGVWLPEVGEMTSISFPSSDPATASSEFRYDAGTETAALASGVTPGESYTFEANITPPVPKATLERLAAGSAPIDISEVPPVLQGYANSWSAGQPSPYDRVMAIAHHLYKGYFSDGFAGVGGASEPFVSLPGNSSGRLTAFFGDGSSLTSGDTVGDGEQYAAAFALMADTVGVPARVVLGAEVGRHGVVTGESVEPWVEIDLAGVGWQPIYVTFFMDKAHKAVETPPTAKYANTSHQSAEPPVISAIHTPLDQQLPGSPGASVSRYSRPIGTGGFHLPMWAIELSAAILAFASLVFGTSGLIAALKRRRRSRRRYLGTPAAQIAGAWSELLDLSRDLGTTIPSRRTRREQAGFLVPTDAVTLAARGDAAVFGPGDPSEEEVGDYWFAADQVAQQMREGLGRLARWRVLISLRSLRPLPGRAVA